MLLATALLIVGLLLVVYSADRLVFAASILCRTFGIPPLIIGMTVGSIAGYCGGKVDLIIMRIVDIIYSLPDTLMVILLATVLKVSIGDKLDGTPLAKIGSNIISLFIVFAVLYWVSMARLIRGQILSLREQEFMLATEACGIKVWHRIFRHLIPNVIPQLIVTCTMGLGSTILTEATLSFLGLGVKYPFASWGNIINDVNNAYVMTNYLFIWIPAGVCLLLTVLGFNFVGDGLRDAFDPKMKR